MGFWDKLFGKKKTNAADAAEQPAARETVQQEDIPPAAEEETAPVQDAAAAQEQAETLPVNENTETDAQEISQPENTPPETESPLEESAAEAEEEPAPPDTPATAAVLPEVQAEAPAAMAEEEPSTAAQEENGGDWPADLPPALVKRMHTYFARLEELYPDKVIVRLNTGHKKLAERGAELRRLAGMEGELDRFFALGGFAYQRSGGGRPPLPLTDADCETMRAKIRELFPDGVPVVMAVRDADSRLYLDLRAVARREDVTVGEYLRSHGLMAGQETVIKS